MKDPLPPTPHPAIPGPPVRPASHMAQDCQQAHGDPDGGHGSILVGDNIANGPQSGSGFQPASLTSSPVLFTPVSPAPRRFLEEHGPTQKPSFGLRLGLSRCYLCAASFTAFDLH